MRTCSLCLCLQQGTSCGIGDKSGLGNVVGIEKVLSRKLKAVPHSLLYIDESLERA
jgi:hypothetical protein